MGKYHGKDKYSRDDSLKDKIFEYISRERFALTTDVANEIEINRNTASKYLNELKSDGVVDYKEVIRGKIWFALNEDEIIINRIKNAKNQIEMINTDYLKKNAPDDFSEVEKIYDSLNHLEKNILRKNNDKSL